MVLRVFERLEKLLDPTRPQAPAMAGSMLFAARQSAWHRRHEEAGVEHVLNLLLAMSDTARALASQNVSVDDAIAAVEQVLDELPTKTGPDEEPPFSAQLDAIVSAARVGGVLRTGKFIEAIAGALPRAFTFLRAPLASVALPLGVLYDGKMSSDSIDGGAAYTFESWDLELKRAAGLMQKLADRHKYIWAMTPPLYFIALLSIDKYRDGFAARGIDVKQLFAEMPSKGKEPPSWARDRPDAVTPAVSPTLQALFLRAERYAAEDASDVKLRHVLAALHDEKDLAPGVERLLV